ncbi:hypothetical protein CDAR_593021 [Caerostris darwini]|uniref:Uncharacterized protein n=1 Tax=Caerostris darwini TaxID=1538125 RepID=A0AAV4MBV6_9ARAC|nr:hypothetical protein CDAR_593021 [Caerostris darwini]
MQTLILVQFKENNGTSFIHFETTFVSSWKLNQLFSDDILSLLDFRRCITFAYLGFLIPSSPSYRKLDVGQVNEDFQMLQMICLIIMQPLILLQFKEKDTSFIHFETTFVA